VSTRLEPFLQFPPVVFLGYWPILFPNPFLRFARKVKVEPLPLSPFSCAFLIPSRFDYGLAFEFEFALGARRSCASTQEVQPFLRFLLSVRCFLMENSQHRSSAAPLPVPRRAPWLRPPSRAACSSHCRDGTICGCV